MALSPSKIVKKVTNQLQKLDLGSCGGQPNSLNEEGFDSQQGTLESTDGHYTQVSAFQSRGKYTSSSSNLILIGRLSAKHNHAYMSIFSLTPNL